MITSIQHSPKQDKKYRVNLSNGEYYDFGLKGSSTYLDHHDKAKREAYRKRHLGNKTEEHYIKSFIASPALFSYYLLWGDSTDIHQNIKELNKHLS
jgi:hypothetical protein